MKLIKTPEAVGQEHCHDMTQNNRWTYNDARFRKCH